MKKSRITKLALSGAAVAALAATFSTSTYAWYVSNKTATVQQATGSTASAAADGSITLSWSGNDDTWFSSLNWNDEGAPSTAFSTALFPVHYVSSTGAYQTGQFYEPLGTWEAGTHYVRTGVNTYAEADAETNVAANVDSLYKLTTASTASTYVTFSLYIKSSSANTTIKPTVTFANTTANLESKAQVAWSDTGSTVTKNQSFVVDSLRAMYYKVDIDEGDDNTGVETKYGAPKATEYVTLAGLVKAPADAHTYYEENSGVGVKDTAVDTAVTTAANAFGNFTVGTTKTKLTFTIWIDGADEDCYNSCALQNFSFDLVFKA